MEARRRRVLCAGPAGCSKWSPRSLAHTLGRRHWRRCWGREHLCNGRLWLWQSRLAGFACCPGAAVGCVAANQSGGLHDGAARTALRPVQPRRHTYCNWNELRPMLGAAATRSKSSRENALYMLPATDLAGVGSASTPHAPSMPSPCAGAGTGRRERRTVGMLDSGALLMMLCF